MKKLLAAIVLLFFVSCNCRYEDAAPISPLKVSFRNYDTSELKTIIVRRYDTNGFYTHMVDWAYVPVSYDTLGSSKAWLSGTYRPGPNYNWEIVMPTVGRTVRVYNIDFEKLQCKKCGWEKTDGLCTTPINSFMQDGKLMNYSNMDSAGLIIVIAK